MNRLNGQSIEERISKIELSSKVIGKSNFKFKISPPEGNQISTDFFSILSVALRKGMSA